MPFEFHEIPGTWYTIDFHVHSPASYDFKGPDCEGEDREDAKYLWLLEQAQQATPDLDIIVIADHNDYRGYEKLIDLRERSCQVERFFIDEGDVVPEKVKSRVELLSSVVMLPGVELDVYPNLHFIVVFDPHTSFEEIDRFLEEAGYSKDIRGQRTIARYAKWKVDEVCQVADSLGAIVIAAHVDSDKGIYNELRGQARVSAFTQEGLFGMEFNSPVSRDQIENILRDPQYRRDTQLAFVRSSDFHGCDGQSIGSPRTWVRLDDVNSEPAEIFRALKEAMRNPVERVADGPPQVVEIRRQLSDEPAVESLESESSIDSFCSFVCAFANSGDGTIVIGRNEKGNWKGVCYETDQEFRDRINAVIRANVKPLPKTEVAIYPCYSDTQFATVRVFKQREIYSRVKDDRVYVLANGGPVQASIEKVVQLAEDRFLQRYKTLSITNRLHETSQRLSGTTDTIDILPIVQKMEARSTNFGTLFQTISKGDLLSQELQEIIELDCPNGYAEGQVIALVPERPRLEDSYLRVTARLGGGNLAVPAFKELTRFSGEKLLVVPQGGVYFDDSAEVVAVCASYPPLIFQMDESYQGPSLKFVTAYLKSTIALWYAERCLGSVDLRSERILSKVLVPTNGFSEDEVVDLVRRIIDIERKYLRGEADCFRDRPLPDSSRDDWEEWVNKTEADVISHNESADTLMLAIDRFFFSLFELSDSEVNLVQRGVKALGLKIFAEPAQ